MWFSPRWYSAWGQIQMHGTWLLIRVKYQRYLLSPYLMASNIISCIPVYLSWSPLLFCPLYIHTYSRLSLSHLISSLFITTQYIGNFNIHQRSHSKDKPFGCLYEGCAYRNGYKTLTDNHMLKCTFKKADEEAKVRWCMNLEDIFSSPMPLTYR